jgi:hypothetical protein
LGYLGHAGPGCHTRKTGILYPVPKRQGGHAMVIGLGAVVAVVIVVVIVLARLKD